MRSRRFPILLLLFSLLAARPAGAEAPVETESVPGGTYGEILFFPEAESRPSDERHRVQAGQKVPLCIRLSPQASDFVARMSEKAMGFQLLLEDSSVPPRRLSIVVGNRLFRLKPDDRTCFGGNWKLPSKTAPGLYQVSDLLWATADQSYYSLRQYLYEFSRAEELEIENPDFDDEAPQLLGLRTYKKAPHTMSHSGGVLKIRLEQSFEIVDEGSGIDHNSLRVIYRLGVGDRRDSLESAKCRRIPQTRRVRCIVSATQPDFFWNAERIRLSLESLSVSDKAGNKLQLRGKEVFRAIAPEAELVFDFQRKKKWKERPDRNLNREAPLPLEGLQAEPLPPESLPQSG